MPPVLTDELEQFARYQVKYGRCLLCDMMAAIVDEGSRAVFDEPLVAWTPDASRWPYELRLAPRAHEADVLRANTGAVAAAFKRALSAVAAATADAPLNAWLHTVPCGAPRAPTGRRSTGTSRSPRASRPPPALSSAPASASIPSTPATRPPACAKGCLPRSEEIPGAAVAD